MAVGAVLWSRSGRPGERNYFSAFMTPIAFFGKVIDEKGNPIENADVYLSPTNSIDPKSKKTQYSRRSDRGGRFSIYGIFGATLYVEVSKEGYYEISEIGGRGGSVGTFRYVGPPSNTDLPIPTAEKPAIFVLRRKGEAAMLHAIFDRSVKIPGDGTQVEMNLDTRQTTGAHDTFLVRCWAEKEKRNAGGQYSWRCNVSVPGGGLVKREGRLDFEAPADGYKASDDITQSEGSWAPSANREYFLKTADNHYARISIQVHTYNDPFIVIESYLNPRLGDRNLEYDSSKMLPVP